MLPLVLFYLFFLLGFILPSSISFLYPFQSAIGPNSKNSRLDGINHGSGHSSAIWKSLGGGEDSSDVKPPKALGFGKSTKPKKSLKTRQNIPQPEQTQQNATPAAGNPGLQIPGADKLTLVYTCKVCEERNLHKISKIAYNTGIVIVNCKGCQNKHLIADNNGLLDVPDFKNIKQYLESRGETVKTPIIDSVKQLKDYELQENSEGDIELIPLGD
mmetsp:Transcript_23027/g.29909  ORF Transcript_23027/g.29909 Transcript_23027/m.29909 type:complete len:215 (-) Transcript_23027:237-881(-)